MSLPPGLTVEEVVKTARPGLITIEHQPYFLDPLDTAGAVYIFGAGHVSRSLAEFTRAVGFRTVVLDDRADFALARAVPNRRRADRVGDL